MSIACKILPVHVGSANFIFIVKLEPNKVRIRIWVRQTDADTQIRGSGSFTLPAVKQFYFYQWTK